MANDLTRRFIAMDAALRCPVCEERLRPPVVTCMNGHTSCEDCVGEDGDCEECGAEICDLPMRVVEEVLQQLPERCPYEHCSKTTLEGHLQYCYYRPIKCILGKDYSCSWSGPVVSWLKHAEEHMNLVNLRLNEKTTLQYRAFDTWNALGLLYFIDSNYFIVSTVKKNDFLYVTVRHVPIKRMQNKYFMETTLTQSGNSQHVLYKGLQPATVLLPNDSFDSDSQCYSIRSLSCAFSGDTLQLVRKFIKE